MEKFVIGGRRRLTGSVTPGGNKNEALPVLAATLLTDQPVTLRNVPRIKDVDVMCQVIEKHGGTVEWLEDNVVRICTANFEAEVLDHELARKVRASILFAGPLVARFGKVEQFCHLLA